MEFMGRTVNDLMMFWMPSARTRPTFTVSLSKIQHRSQTAPMPLQRTMI